MAGNFDGIKTRNFGIEIEMTGLTRCQAAKALSGVLGGEVVHEGGIYDKRPCVGEGFIHDKTYGFYIDTASDILIDDCTVTWGDIRPDRATEGIGQKDVRNLKIKE